MSSPYFLTFFQAIDKKIKVKKGSKGRLIVYYKIHTFTDSNSEEIKKCPLIRYSYVDNLEDVEGYLKPQSTLQTGKDVLEKSMLNHCPDIMHNLNSAFYDRVNESSRQGNLI